MRLDVCMPSVVLCVACVGGSAFGQAATRPATEPAKPKATAPAKPKSGPDLPPAELAVKDDVDHWGLAFSDQVTRFRAAFDRYARLTGRPAPKFILGVETSLRKTFPNKYWFKGEPAAEIRLSAGRNEREAFQLAVIPDTGTALHEIQVTASDLKQTGGPGTIPASAVRLYRVGFVETAAPQYPVKNVGAWPDPLMKLEPFSLDGLELGLIWCEIAVPRDAPPGDYAGEVSVAAREGEAALALKLHVWQFALPDRPPFATTVFFSPAAPKGRMSDDDVLDYAAAFLEHGVDPISLGATDKLDELDKRLEFCFRRGMVCFRTLGFRPDKPETFKPYYEHIKARGWLEKAMCYGAVDEPPKDVFESKVVPATEALRKAFPGLRVFLATEYHPGLDRGVDVWLTDVSTNFHSWLAAGRPGKQELWWYFCHLPIHVDMERPLVEAPNMLIDNDAIEHRLPYWMAGTYGVKGFFIWSGNSWPTGPDRKPLNPDWPEKPFELSKAKYPYPYAGIHNGNGYLLYPGPIPSLRIKILRDGLEDWWYLEQARALAAGGGALAKEAQALLAGIQPAVFVDTHYFNRDPRAILDYRAKLGDLLDRAAK